MLTRLDAALRASEPLAVEELRPRAVEGGARSLLVQLERGAEMLVQVVVSPEEALQAGDGGECPRRSRALASSESFASSLVAASRSPARA
jgi:hypothetical protein